MEGVLCKEGGRRIPVRVSLRTQSKRDDDCGLENNISILDEEITMLYRYCISRWKRGSNSDSIVVGLEKGRQPSDTHLVSR